MRKTSRLSTLLLAVALVPAGMVRGQCADVGYAQLLIQFDRNGNGLLEDHERAAMLAASREQAPQPLSAFPLICEGQTFGGFGGAVARVEQQQESPPLPQVARHIQLRHNPFAENQPPDDAQPDQDELASTHGYAPAAPPAPRQPVRIRNAVQYRMLLNEQQAQPRSQPFAQAATFGPTIGLAKYYPRHSFAATAHVGCAGSRWNLVRAGY